MAAGVANFVFERGASNGFTLRVWDDEAKTMPHDFGSNKVRIIINKHGSADELFAADSDDPEVVISGHEVGFNIPPGTVFPEGGAATFVVEEFSAGDAFVDRLLKGHIKFA